MLLFEIVRKDRITVRSTVSMERKVRHWNWINMRLRWMLSSRLNTCEHEGQTNWSIGGFANGTAAGRTGLYWSATVLTADTGARAPERSDAAWRHTSARAERIINRNTCCSSLQRAARWPLPPRWRNRRTNLDLNSLRTSGVTCRCPCRCDSANLPVARCGETRSAR